jgi:hypothetical protein
MPAPLTDAGVEFLFDLLRIPFDATDRLWFFSDWLTVVPRTFEERLHDHCISRGVYQSSPRPLVHPGRGPFH